MFDNKESGTVDSESEMFNNKKRGDDSDTTDESDDSSDEDQRIAEKAFVKCRHSYEQQVNKLEPQILMKLKHDSMPLKV